MATRRQRPDRCPGAVRPWPAEDGLLVRIRLVGGRVDSDALEALAQVAETYGDGRIHPTSRANLQLRGLPGTPERLAPVVHDALRATGLLPSASHELVRNILVSPQTGLGCGRADLRQVAANLDRRICASPDLATLPGRFLFVLDDGRGDVIHRAADLAAVVVDDGLAQVRAGEVFGPVVALDRVAEVLAGLAEEFVRRRGTGADAPWHVSELAEPLIDAEPPHPGLPGPVPPLAYGLVPGGVHEPVGEAGLTRAEVARLTHHRPHVIVTPWRGILVPQKGVHHATA